MKNNLRKLSASAIVLTALSASAIETPTMGWSSWNTYRVNISEELICKQADALISKGLKDFGYIYVNTDDGFFGGRDAEGKLLFHPERFPNGMKPVVDHIHGLGLKAGIYSDAGHNTCGHYFDKDAAGVGVGLYEHDEDDANHFFTELGFDFIKIDFCGGDAGKNTEKLDLDERERYTAIRKAIDAVGREDVRINVCRWAFPGTWVHDIGSSWRISGDISANWNSVKNIINKNRHRSAYAGGGHYNDMDMLEIGRGLSEAQERSHFGMWCIMSSPLLIGCDLTSIPERSLNLLKNPEVIALNQDQLGLQAYEVAVGSDVQLYVKDIETLNGLTRAVALYNPTDNEVNFTLNPADVNLGGKVEVRDLFSRTDLDPIADGATATYTVGKHDTKLLRLTAEKRIERSLYEAETAWLERFQEIGINNSEGHAKYSNYNAAYSGGFGVGWLGNHPDNWMEWRNVYCEKGGVYTLDIAYMQYEDRKIELTVNGGETETITLPALEKNKVRTHTVKIVLATGMNTIRIGNSNAWAPDIDYIRLTPDEVNTIDSVEAPAGKRSSVSRIASTDGLLRLPAEGKYSIWSANGRRITAPAGTTELHTTPGIYFILAN